MGRPEIKVRRRKAPEPEPANPKKRAAELVASGMPFHLATAVSQGKLELNEALERMAQRDEVERLMRVHDLSRALATQVALGHADLEAFLTKRRFQQHREAHLDDSCLMRSKAEGKPLVFGLFGQRRVEAVVLDVSTYQVVLQPTEGQTETLHKLDFKFAYAADDYKRVKKVMRKNKELSEAPQRPAERPQDRYTCSDKRLFRFLDEHVAVDVTLLEGEVFHGEVAWFGRFEFGLSAKGGAEVTLFRHALHRIGEPR